MKEEKSAMTSEKPAQVKYPEDGWLKGYFYIIPDAAVLDGEQVPTGVWKNRDCLRLRDYAIHLLAFQPGMKVLDVGCADGVQMVYCGLQGATVYGQDLSPEAVSAANATLQRLHIDGQASCGDASKLQFPDNHFDAVISSDFFEHITDDIKVQVLQEILRVLKPGGPLVIKTPNLTYLRLSLLYKRIRALAHLKNPLNVVIPHTPGTFDPDHVGLTTRWRLTCSIMTAGFVNYQFFYAPLRRFGPSYLMEVFSTEIPVVRDWLCEDLFCRVYKPIALSHFPD